MNGDFSPVLTVLGDEGFPGVVESVAGMRKWAERLLSGARLPEGHCAAVVLTLSELATNALVHTASGHVGGEIRGRLFVGGATTRLEVMDGGSTSVPVLLRAGPWAERGRGLSLVDAVTDGWGRLDGEAPGVWAEVRWWSAVPPPPMPSPADDESGRAAGGTGHGATAHPHSGSVT